MKFISATLQPFSQEITVQPRRGTASDGEWIEIKQDHDINMVSRGQFEAVVKAMRTVADELGWP